MLIELDEIEIATIEDGLRALEAEWALAEGGGSVEEYNFGETLAISGRARKFTMLRAKLAGLR